MKLFKIRRYSGVDEPILLGPGSSLVCTRTGLVEGTVDAITDDTVYVICNGNRAAAATVHYDELEMDTAFQDATLEPPPIPMSQSFVGGTGHTQRKNCARVVLSYSHDNGWSLKASDRAHTDGIPPEIYHQHILEFTLYSDTLLELRPEDRELFVAPLGDLTQILIRIAAGHSIVWDGNNHVGVLTPDAREARQELNERIMAADFHVPEACAPEAVLGLEYEFEPRDTPEEIVAGVESEMVRVWGGVDAVKELMAQLVPVPYLALVDATHHAHALVSLSYDPCEGWTVRATDAAAGNPLQDAIRDRRVLVYELAKTPTEDLEFVCDSEDLLKSLGDDLGSLLLNIALGHSIGPDGMGVLTSEAATAEAALKMRIERARPEMLESLS